MKTFCFAAMMQKEYIYIYIYIYINKAKKRQSLAKSTFKDDVRKDDQMQGLNARPLSLSDDYKRTVKDGEVKNKRQTLQSLAKSIF